VIFLEPEEILTRVENAVAELAWEAQTPEQVAAVLDRAGARGKRREPIWCPLHFYLSAVTGYGPIGVAGNVTAVGFARRVHVTVKHPDVIETFIEEFDGGAYPSLDMDILVPNGTVEQQVGTLALSRPESVVAREW
jgi:hypothetical protein